MKNKIILAALALVSGVSLNAQTAVSRTVGASTLIAGFDFNGAYANASTVNARYSDLYTPGDVNTSTGNSLFGNLHFTSNGGTFTGAVLRTTSAGNYDATDRSITSRTGGVDFLGEQGGADGSFSLNTVAATPRFFSFQVTSSNAFNTFTDINLSYTARNNTAGVSSIGVDWFYATSAAGTATPIATGLATTTVNGAYSVYTADFSAVAGMEGIADLFIIGRLTESADTAAFNFDNVGIYGTAAAAAIPEPSSFAVLAGAACLGLVTLRRRRASK